MLNRHYRKGNGILLDVNYLEKQTVKFTTDIDFSDFKKQLFKQSKIIHETSKSQ